MLPWDLEMTIRSWDLLQVQCGRKAHWCALGTQLNNKQQELPRLMECSSSQRWAYPAQDLGLRFTDTAQKMLLQASPQQSGEELDLGFQDGKRKIG